MSMRGPFGPAGADLWLGDIRIRVRRNPGAGVPPCLWDVMDGERVAETFASVPSKADAEDALRKFRAGLTPEARFGQALARASSSEAVRRQALSSIFNTRGRPRKTRNPLH